MNPFGSIWFNTGNVFETVLIHFVCHLRRAFLCSSSDSFCCADVASSYLGGAATLRGVARASLELTCAELLFWQEPPKREQVSRNVEPLAGFFLLAFVLGYFQSYRSVPTLVGTPLGGLFLWASGPGRRHILRRVNLRPLPPRLRPFGYFLFGRCSLLFLAYCRCLPDITL